MLDSWLWILRILVKGVAGIRVPEGSLIDRQ